VKWREPPSEGNSLERNYNLNLTTKDKTYKKQINPDEYWPDPKPIERRLPPVATFDEQLLPESMRPLAQDVANRMQVPLDFIAIPLVICLSAAVGRRATIQPKANDPSWLVVPNLYGGIVSPSGFMKSPVIGAAIRPLTTIEGEWRDEDRLALAQWERQSELEIPGRKVDKPKRRRLVANDSTFEALHEVLRDNPAGLLVVHDELAGWLGQLDRAGREGERAFYLSAWNGDTGHTIMRIKRGEVHVPACCLSMLGGIQPEKLRTYLTGSLDKAKNNDGLVQRFQLLVWPDLNPNFVYVDRPPDSDAEDAIFAIFLELSHGDPENPKRLRFSPEAQRIFVNWFTELEKKIRSGSLHPVLAGHYSKYRSLVPTLALLFELADRTLDDSATSSVSIEHTERAIRWVTEYLPSHVERVYAAALQNSQEAALKLAEKLKVQNIEMFSARDVYNSGWELLQNPEQVHDAAKRLVEAGWLQEREVRPGPKGGRPTVSYIVNPKLFRGG
jgi:putative DNA primase/helicase